MIPRIFIGFDQREALAYHVCSQSIIEQANSPIAIYPLSSKMVDCRTDGTNTFTLSRYLIPMLCDYQGWAIFIDGDMVVDIDIAQLWAWQYTHSDKAVAVVKHEYKTKHPKKYIGTRMESDNIDYPRKNWSSVVLWNCAHPQNRCLDTKFISTNSAAFLHRFAWLDVDDIGSLSAGWNYLVGEYSPSGAHIYHYTLGIPAIKRYADDCASWKWHQAYLNAMQCAGENAVDIADRADRRMSFGAIRAV